MVRLERTSSRAGVLEGVDVRGLGGYVVAPPSVHPDGWRYQFIDESGDRLRAVLPDRPLSPAPAWLLDRLRPAVGEPRRESAPIRLSSSHYARVAVESECAAVAATPQGSRNQRLNAAAFSLGTLVGAEVLDAGDARLHLLDAALRAGLDERESLATIASGLNAGERQPRRIAETRSSGGRQREQHRAAEQPKRPDQNTTAELPDSVWRSQSVEGEGSSGPTERLGQAAGDELEETFEPFGDDESLGPYGGYEAEWSAGAAIPRGLES